MHISDLQETYRTNMGEYHFCQLSIRETDKSIFSTRYKQICIYIK